MQNILPDAVKRDSGGRDDGDASSSTSSSDNLLTVNKDRIYMAGVGAVKELSGITDDIIEKIDHLEQVYKWLDGDWSVQARIMVRYTSLYTVYTLHCRVYMWHVSMTVDNCSGLRVHANNFAFLGEHGSGWSFQEEVWQ